MKESMMTTISDENKNDSINQIKESNIHDYNK